MAYPMLARLATETVDMFMLTNTCVICNVNANCTATGVGYECGGTTYRVNGGLAQT